MPTLFDWMGRKVRVFAGVGVEALSTPPRRASRGRYSGETDNRFYWLQADSVVLEEALARSVRATIQGDVQGNNLVNVTSTKVKHSPSGWVPR